MAGVRDDSVATRLDNLFVEIRPAGRRGRMYTNDAVAAAVRAANPGMRVTGAYLSALRNGTRDNPSIELRRALARFFGVPAGYLIDDAVAARTDAEIRLAQVAANHGVLHLAFRALELSPAGLAAVAQALEQVLSSDGPDPPRPGSPPRPDGAADDQT